MLSRNLQNSQFYNINIQSIRDSKIFLKTELIFLPYTD